MAQFVSLFGDRLHQFSVVGMIGRVAPGSSFELFQFAIFSFLPVLLFAPLIGAVIDRTNKVLVIVLVDVARGLIVLAVPALYHATGSLYAFYATALLLALANLLFAPAKSALIPEVFAGDRLLHINAVLWGLGIAGALGGFIAGGWLFDFHRWEWSFYADGTSYLLSVPFLLPLFAAARAARHDRSTAPPASGATAPSLLRDARDGFAVARRHGPIAYGLIVQAGAWTALGILYVVGIAHLQAIFPHDRTIYLSVVASTGTVGLLVGAAMTSWLGRRRRTHRLVIAATVLLGVSWIGIALCTSVAMLAAWLFVLGVSTSPMFVLTETLLQVETPLEFRGRVFALREVATKVLFLVASAVATAADMVLDKTLIILVVGVFLAGTGVLLGRTSFPRT